MIAALLLTLLPVGHCLPVADDLQVCRSVRAVTLMRADADYPNTFVYVAHVGALTEEG